MQNNKKNEIKVGIVSIIGLLLIIAVLVFTKNFSFSSANTPILIQFDNALGLVEGAPVFVNGVKHGAVSKVWLNNGAVFVNAEIDNVNDLKEDCAAEIMMLEITGGKKIEISPGNSSNLFNPKNTLAGNSTTDIASMVSKFSGITNELGMLIHKVDTLITNANQTIENPNIVAIIDNTATATASINELIHSDEVKGTLLSLNNSVKYIENFLVNNNPKLTNIVANLDTTANKAKTTLTKLDTTINLTNNAINNANQVISDIQNNGGLANKLLYDTAFANKMSALLDSLNALATQIKEHGINTNVRLGTRP